MSCRSFLRCASHSNFFTLSSVSLEASVPAIQFDWWLDWSQLSLPELPADIRLELTAKIAGTFGLIFFLVELISSTIETVAVNWCGAAKVAQGPQGGHRAAGVFNLHPPLALSLQRSALRFVLSSPSCGKCRVMSSLSTCTRARAVGEN